MVRMITREEYNETIAYYKQVKRLPHPLMITANKNGSLKYNEYNMLTDDVKIILNDYKEAR